MDEKQLEEINHQSNPEIQNENPSANESDSGKKILEWAVIGLALGFVIVAVGFFICNKLR